MEDFIEGKKATEEEKVCKLEGHRGHPRRRECWCGDRLCNMKDGKVRGKEFMLLPLIGGEDPKRKEKESTVRYREGSQEKKEKRGGGKALRENIMSRRNRYPNTYIKERLRLFLGGEESYILFQKTKTS